MKRSGYTLEPVMEIVLPNVRKLAHAAYNRFELAKCSARYHDKKVNGNNILACAMKSLYAPHHIAFMPELMIFAHVLRNCREHRLRSSYYCNNHASGNITNACAALKSNRGAGSDASS